METINDRMEMLVNERFGGNKAAFAKAIDLTPTAISSYLGTKRRSKPSVEMVTNIVTKLNVDAYWLLTGEKREQDNVAVNGSHNQVNGDGAHGNINGESSVDVAVLQERIKAMQKLLDEKERTIKILMSK
jgi:transcriptional regulator with XRE-family HTH domain